MTVAEQLLVSILKYKNIQILSKIEREWLDTKEIKSYRTITDYYKEHGELMGVKSFCKTFDLDEGDVDSRPTLYLQKLKDRHIFTKVSEDIPPLLRKLKEDPKGILNAIKTLINNISADEGSSKDTPYSEGASERLKEYYERARTGGVTYLSMGHPLLDKLFYGYRKNDLITIAGRAGSRKTWLICFLVLLAELVLPEDYGDILLISNEMPADELKERMDCIRFLLPYEEFLTGSLSREQLGRYKKGLKELDEVKPRIILIEHCSTVEEVSVKMGLYKPSLVAIDGSYLLEPQMEEDHRKITFITRSLKKLSLTMGIPIINTTQLGRGKGTKERATSFEAQDDFSFGMGFVQNSDLAISTFQNKDMVYYQEFGLQVAKGRRVKANTVVKFQCPLGSMKLDFNDDEIDTEEMIEL